MNGCTGDDMSQVDFVIVNSHENAKWTAEYRSVCTARPPDYSYYGQLEITWGDLEDYECHHKLGRGKYSEVYQGVNIGNK